MTPHPAPCLSCRLRRVLAPAVLLAALAPGAARGQPAAPPAVPGDLALALVDVGYNAVPDSTLAVAGRLPDGLPAAAALPRTGRVLGGARWPSGTMVAVVSVDDAPAAARAGALAALEAAGWRPPPPRVDPVEDGYLRFLDSAPADPLGAATRCAPDGTGGSALVSARRRGDGTGALVRVLAYPRARSARCRPPARFDVAGGAFPSPRLSRPLAPGALRAPAGVRVLNTGTSGGDRGPYVVTATATGDSADPARLRAHFAGRLAAAGWTAVAVPGWDTTRSTPLFVSPRDTNGARWAGAVTAVPDTTPARDDVPAGSRRAALSLTLTPVEAGRGGELGSMFLHAGMMSWSTLSGSGEVTVAVPGRATARAVARAGADTRPPVARELVDALLTLNAYTGGGTRGRDLIVVGRPPQGWAAPIPAAPGRRVLGGTAGAAGTDDGDGQGVAASSSVAVVVPGLPRDVQAAYLRQLDSAGWRPSAQPALGEAAAWGFGPAPAGPEAAPAGAVRCAPRRDVLLTVSAEPRAAGGTLLQLATLGGGAAASACTPPDSAAEGLRARMLRELRAPLPPLAAPPGVTVTRGTGSGSGGRWEASATVRGPASPEAVLAAYAPQLRAAGWSVGAPAAGPDLAAVRLTRAARPGADDDGPWTGLLSAVWRPGGAYAVALSVRRDGPTR